ncbi:MAG TPA: hypothetical protein VK211_13550 [Kamptonema sp.]|nr:hypothetical protein [Kamptonema sp.]
MLKIQPSTKLFLGVDRALKAAMPSASVAIAIQDIAAESFNRSKELVF